MLSRAKGGDESARNELFATLEVRLRPILQSRVRGWAPADLDDILQNALMVVVEKLSQLESNPHYFALNVLRNKIGDAMRARQGYREVGLEEEGAIGRGDSDGSSDHSLSLADPDGEFESLQEARDLAGWLLKAVKHLSKFCQAMFAAVIEGRSIAEVWDLSRELEPNLKRSAFDKRVFDCRKRLRALLKGIE